jgi:hypothetical protein
MDKMALGEVSLNTLGSSLANYDSASAVYSVNYYPKEGRRESEGTQRRRHYPTALSKNIQTNKTMQFLSPFAKFAKWGYWHRHVVPCVRLQQLGFHWTDFHEI